MLVFEHSNFIAGVTCPICGTAEDKPVTLVKIDGTFDGGLCEGMQVHVDCLDLRIKKVDNGKQVIYQIIGETK
jgi:hypothetical protein